MKKLFPLLLAVLTALCLGGSALALDTEDPYLSSAEALHELGLFQGTGTNADGIALSRGGVRTGLISLPQRYMHTPIEVVRLSDIEAVGKLLAAYVLNPAL